MNSFLTIDHVIEELFTLESKIQFGKLGIPTPLSLTTPIFSSGCSLCLLLASGIDQNIVNKDHYEFVQIKRCLAPGWRSAQECADLLSTRFWTSYWTLTLEVSQTSTLITCTLMLSLSDLTFSSGGDDEGSAAANSVMHASADGDRRVCLEEDRVSVGKTDGSAELGAPPPPLSLLLTSQHHQHQCVISDEYHQNCDRHQEIEVRSLLVPLAPHRSSWNLYGWNLMTDV
ncbi:hypothetical protein Tco_1272304 [Tanacetum coccineum]